MQSQSKLIRMSAASALARLDGDAHNNAAHVRAVYIGREGDGGWGNPFESNNAIKESALAEIPVSMHPQWIKAGARLNKARTLALYALLLGMRLRRGALNLRALCEQDPRATEPDRLRASTLACSCSLKLCHGEVALACATWYAQARNRRMTHGEATRAVETALLGIDTTKPGWTVRNLQAALDERLQYSPFTPALNAHQAVLSRAISETVETIKASQIAWTTHSIRRTCIERMTNLILLGVGNSPKERRQTGAWQVQQTHNGMSVKVSQEFLNLALDTIHEVLKEDARRDLRGAD